MSKTELFPLYLWCNQLTKYFLFFFLLKKYIYFLLKKEVTKCTYINDKIQFVYVENKEKKKKKFWIFGKTFFIVTMLEL